MVKPAQAADGKTPQELPEPINVRMGQEGLPQTHGMITAFKSPFAKDQTVTLVTAATPDTLWRCMGTLVTPDVWSQLEGDTVLWTAPTKEVAAQRAGKVFYVGNPNINELARFHLSKNPFVWVAGVFLLIILWAWLTYVLLRRRFKRRHGLGVTVED